jgi:intergrase/recombinase
MFSGSVSWFESLDLANLSDEDRYRILDFVVGKVGRDAVRDALRISRYTLWRLLNRRVRVDDAKLRVLLSFLSREEFEQLVSVGQRLRALGIVREDGSVDYGLALEVLALARRDEYLKQALLRFVVQEFREDLKRMLGISFAGVMLEWSEDFEQYLRLQKKRQKVRTEEQLAYYRSLFKRYLEGRELTEQLIEQVARHPNGWLRNVFRHYVRYLYHRRRISGETMAWILEVVPSRSYRLDVRVHPVKLEELAKTLEFLRQRHPGYYALYRLLLESGARVEHALRMLAEWSPEEQVEIPGYGFTQRLVCLEDRGFCRYYVGQREGQKPCEWVYFSLETLGLLEEAELLGKRMGRKSVTHYAEKHGLVRPKYLRKVAWQLMRRSMGYEAAAFAQSRFGELRISERRYSDLLSEADQVYPRYIERLVDVWVGLEASR